MVYAIDRFKAEAVVLCDSYFMWLCAFLLRGLTLPLVLLFSTVITSLGEERELDSLQLDNFLYSSLPRVLGLL